MHSLSSYPYAIRQEKHVMKTHSKSIFNIFTFFALLASLIGSTVNVTPAYAAGITVTKTADTASLPALQVFLV